MIPFTFPRTRTKQSAKRKRKPFLSLRALKRTQCKANYFQEQRHNSASDDGNAELHKFAHKAKVMLYLKVYTAGQIYLRFQINALVWKYTTNLEFPLVKSSIIFTAYRTQRDTNFKHEKSRVCKGSFLDLFLPLPKNWSYRFPWKTSSD